MLNSVNIQQPFGRLSAMLLGCQLIDSEIPTIETAFLSSLAAAPQFSNSGLEEALHPTGFVPVTSSCQRNSHGNHGKGCRKFSIKLLFHTDFSYYQFPVDYLISQIYTDNPVARDYLSTQGSLILYQHSCLTICKQIEGITG